MENDKDIQALNSLVEEAVEVEKALAVQSKELAERDKQFADFLTAQKHNQEQFETLKIMIKDKMEELGLNKHQTEHVALTLSPSGKFRTDDIESVSDELCDIKKVLNNKKVKAFLELNGKLPEGVEATSKVLRMKVLD